MTTPFRKSWAWCMTHRAAAGLIVSFAAVAVTFIAGTAFAQNASFEIRAAAEEITGNSSASISQLSTVRTRLAQLEIRAEDHIEDCQDGACPALPDCIPALLREIRGRWEEYKKLPTFPTEAQHWPVIDAEFQRLDEALGGMQASLQRKDFALAKSSFRNTADPTFRALDADVSRLMEHEHEQGLAVAARIDALAKRSLIRALLLDLLSVALTVLAARLALRLVAREERLLQARADDLDRFAGQVSHEILNPLCAMDATLYAARHGAVPPSRRTLDRLQDGVDYVRHLATGLLDFARSSSLGPTHATSELREVVERVLDQLAPLAERERVELGTRGVVAGTVAASDCVLATILSNLVANGIKHLGSSDARAVSVRTCSAAPDRVRFEVVDTGPGIDPAVRDHVFEPFVRGPAMSGAGFGLGLATVKRLVEASGGAVGFAPAPSGGTCFWVELPRGDAIPQSLVTHRQERDRDLVSVRPSA